MEIKGIIHLIGEKKQVTDNMTKAGSNYPNPRTVPTIFKGRICKR